MDSDRLFMQEVLDVAVNAPSGHNCQPWKFVYDKGLLYLWNLPEKDRTLFNHKQKGSLVSCGAVIENIVIASSEKGFEATVELFPESNKKDLVAKIKFTKTANSYPYKYLFPYILKRTTNRKPFKEMSLSSLHEKEIREFIESDQLIKESILTQTGLERIPETAKLFSIGDRILFDNFYLHKALFSIVNWTAEEEKERRHGLYVETKELSPPIKVIFKHFIRNWKLFNAVSFLDLPSKMGRKRSALYRKSSVIGLVTSEIDSPEGFVNAGRILQRLWLKVTSVGLSFQPISVGLLYLGQWLQNEKPQEITQRQYEYVRTAYARILELFSVNNRIPSFSFRIGYSDRPTASSLKKPPDITFV